MKPYFSAFPHRAGTAALALTLALASGCKDYLDVPPQGQLSEDAIRTDPAAAQKLVDGVYNAKKQARTQSTDNVEAAFATDRWTPGNPTNATPRALTPSMPNSTFFLESGSYLRLTNLVLGYTVPGTALEKAHLASVRVFAAAQNVFTATKYTGFTPELAGGPLDSGIELNTYPTSRTVTLGLNVNFK